MKKPHALIAGRMAGALRLMLCCAGFAHAAAHYDVTDLGLPANALPGRIAINDNGLVAGTYQLSNETTGHAYVWSGGTLTTLALPDSASDVGITAMNAAGVLGRFEVSDKSHAFTWQGGVLTLLTPANGVSSSAALINGEGDVLGAWEDSNGRGHGFIFRHGSFADLTPAGAVSGSAKGMTTDGRVVGLFNDSKITAHAFLWENGAFSELSLPTNAEEGSANAINEAGVIVGMYYDANYAAHPCIWINGVFADLGLPSGYANATALAINDSGVIAGECWGSDGRNHIFVLKNGVFTVAEPSGATTSYLTTLLPAGSLIGSYRWYTATRQNSGAFAWANGNTTLLAPATATDSYISDYTSDGQIVGEYLDAGFDEHPFIYQNGTLTDFAGIDLDRHYGVARAINESGKVVGELWKYDTASTWTDDDRAFLVEGGIFKSLSALVEPSWTVNAAKDVNASGLIVAFVTTNNTHRAVLLTPAAVTPTPNSTPTKSQTSLPSKVQPSIKRSWLLVPIKVSNPAGLGLVNASIKGAGMKTITKSWDAGGVSSFSTFWKVRVREKARAGSISEAALRKGLQLEISAEEAVQKYKVRVRRK
jgi:probable HAF family extracellular repeat protein